MAGEVFTSEAKSKVAQEKTRDEEGHFIENIKKSAKETLSHLEKNVDYNKKQDDLLNVHVGNPLKRVTDLLEDIKRQKAFAFTLKGSLGLAGVAIALSVFGIFGGSKMLCDKGTQTEVGIIRILNVQEAEDSNVPILGFIIDSIKETLGTQTLHNRVILQPGSGSTINLPHSGKLSVQGFKDREVFVTGKFDECSRVLKPENIEAINKLI